MLIVNNVINAGDDGICMKGGIGENGRAAGPCENINIQDNTVYHAHGGFVIGSEFSGGMTNLYVHNNTFSGTDTGVRFKSAVGRGGVTKDIYISIIYMTDSKTRPSSSKATMPTNAPAPPSNRANRLLRPPSRPSLPTSTSQM